MTFEVEHYMIYSLSPIIGLFFSYISSKKFLKLTFIGSILALIPILTGYEFLFDAYYECIITIQLSFGFKWLFQTEKKSRSKSIVSSLLFCFGILIITGFITFINAFTGSNTSISKIKIDSYQIDHIRSLGFSGSPAYYYKLTHKPAKGLFYKVYKQRGQQINDCTIEFKVDGEKQQFNICQ